MTETNLPQDMTLLLVDDDKPFLTRLARAMETRGFAVRMAETVAEGVEQVKKEPPGYAVVDLRLGDGNGLDVIEAEAYNRRIGDHQLQLASRRARS